MKHIFIHLISFYQMVLSPALRMVLGVKHACRFPISCSEYTKQQIQTHGVGKGAVFGCKRLLSCHPFGTIQ